MHKNGRLYNQIIHLFVTAGNTAAL